MNKRMASCGLAALSLLWAAACSNSAAAPSVSFTSPVATQPLSGTTFKYSQQPLTLTIANAVRTGTATATYTVEVATDAGFGNRVFTKDGVAEGSGGTTSLQISTLPGATTYFWRWKTVVDGTTGQPSPSQTFVLQPQVVISAPTGGDPANGGLAGDARPTLSVTNATSTGPAGPLFYEFQVSTTASFGSILVASGPVAEQPGRTSWTSPTDLPASTFYWRVRATDSTSGEASGFTDAASFTVEPFNMRKAIILNNPPDLADWAQTASITLVDYSTGRFVVDFDKRLGPGRWPDVGFGDGDLEYTLGMCVNVSKQWYCSATVQFWYGRDLTEGGDINLIGRDWWYDQRWGPIIGHQPAFGEIVGIFVAAGNLRDLGNVITKERSNVLLIPYGQAYRK
jgi:hypothetical protein